MATGSSFLLITVIKKRNQTKNFYKLKKYCDVGMIQHWLQKSRKLRWSSLAIKGNKLDGIKLTITSVATRPKFKGLGHVRCNYLQRM